MSESAQSATEVIPPLKEQDDTITADTFMEGIWKNNPVFVTHSLPLSSHPVSVRAVALHPYISNLLDFNNLKLI